MLAVQFKVNFLPANIVSSSPLMINEENYRYFVLRIFLVSTSR